MAKNSASFSNPSGGAQERARAYIEALLALLGEDDPWEIQRQQDEKVRGAIEGLTQETLRRREAAGKWSVMEVVSHLADTEWVAGYRYRATLAEDGPSLPGYDQDLWVGRLGSNEAPLEPTLERLQRLRHWNLELLGSVSEDDWQRAGHHSERGHESLGQLFRLLAAHDLVHLRQIARIRKTLEI